MIVGLDCSLLRNGEVVNDRRCLLFYSTLESWREIAIFSRRLRLEGIQERS